MNEAMLKDLNKLLDGEPYVPFQVILTSGTIYEVKSPFQLVPEGSKVSYFFARSSRTAFFRINQIVSVETLDV